MGPAVGGVVTGDQFEASAEKRGPTAGQGQAESDSSLRGGSGPATATEGFENRSRVGPINTGARIHDLEVKATVVRG